MYKRYFRMKDHRCKPDQIEWIEMTGREFYRFVNSPEGRGRYFVDMDDVVLETSEAEARSFRVEKNHRYYIQAQEENWSTVSLYVAEDGDGCSGEEAARDETQDVEAEAIRQMETAALRQALGCLDSESYQMIHALYLADSRKTLSPVHLLSCDDTGAVQLQIMAQPNYRERLARAALKEAYQPPPLDVPTWDAIYQGRPLVIAADMDLRRLDAAIQAARSRGLERIAVAALEKQAKTVLIPRYQDTGQARVFALTKEAIAEVTGWPPVPYTPPHTQFLTEKGDVVDAPPIRIPGKAGGQAGGKVRPLV